MSPTNLSRRAILAGAASVPVLALPAVVATAAPTAATMLTAAPDPVIALAEQMIEAFKTCEAAGKAFTPFEEAMIEWREKNPTPASVKVDHKPLNPTSAASLSAASLSVGEQGIVAILRTPLDEYKAANEQNKAAMAKWKRREKAAKRRSGFRKAEVHYNEKVAKLCAANQALRDARPRTLNGLVAKARAALIADPDNVDYFAPAVMQDVVDLYGTGLA